MFKVKFHPHISMKITKYVKDSKKEVFIVLIGKIKHKIKETILEINDCLPFYNNAGELSDKIIIVEPTWFYTTLEYIKLKHFENKSTRILGVLHSHITTNSVSPTPPDIDFAKEIAKKYGDSLIIIVNKRLTAKCFIIKENSTIKLNYKTLKEMT